MNASARSSARFEAFLSNALNPVMRQGMVIYGALVLDPLVIG